MLPNWTSDPGRRALRAAVLLAALLSLAVTATAISRADDGDPADAPPLVAPDGPFLGVLPQTDNSVSGEDDTPTEAQVSRPLVYRGGSVMRSNTVYAIYWVPAGYSVSRNYTSVINGFFANVARDSKKHTNVYGTDAQYYEKDAHGNTRPIAYSVSVGGSVVDTSPFPSSGCTPAGSVCLTDGQLKTELSKVIRAHGWPSGYSQAYFLLLPKRVDLCMTPGACTYSPSGGFCAYHSYYGSGPTIYAAIPYAAGLGCSSGQRPNGDDADDTLNGLSHEHNEMVTDPDQAGWIDAAGYENGDKCAWTFGSALGGAAGAKFNQAIGGGHYYLQEEWSNDGSRCLQRY